MAFSIVFQCPLHPTYMGKMRPTAPCKACRLMFDIRNNTNKVLSVPREERDDLTDIVIKEVL